MFIGRWSGTLSSILDRLISLDGEPTELSIYSLSARKSNVDFYDFLLSVPANVLEGCYPVFMILLPFSIDPLQFSSSL